MTRATERRGPAREIPGARRGVTLVELLVALTIGGILATLVFRFLEGQSRFVQTQTGRQEVQQNARVALDVIASELRGLSPSRGDIVRADRYSIVIRLPRAYGVQCSGNGSPGGAVRVSFAPDPDLRLTTNSASGLVVRSTPTGWTELPRVRTQNSGAAAATFCNQALDPASPQARVAREFDVPSPAPLGAPVYLFDRVSYWSQAGATVGRDRRWLYRSNGVYEDGRFVSAPFAGPLQPDGLRFTFYGTNGDVPLSTPVSNPEEIRRIDVTIAVESQARDPQRRQQERDSVSVMLRN